VIWKFLAQYWMHVVGAVLLAALLLVVKHWHSQAQLVPGLKQQVQDVTAAAAKYRDDMAAEIARVQTVSKGVQDELNTLKEAAAAPVPVVRCVRYPRAAAVPPGSEARPLGDGTVAGAGELPPQVGPDIGPDLYALADRADEIVAACRGAQSYILGLPAAVPQ
jgi:hypothetical protein